MNIILMTTHLNAGGITSYLLTLAKGLIQLGHTVHMVSSGGGISKDFQSAGVRLLELNIKTKSELSPKIYFSLKPLKKYMAENNIHLMHAQTRITQVMAARLSKSMHIPFVSTCHGYFRVRLSRKWAPCWGHAVLAISEAVQAHLLEDFNEDPKNVHLIPSGIDLNEFQPCSDEEKLANRNRFNLNGGPVVGMVARLSDVKGPDILVESIPEVIRHHPSATFLLVGEGRMEKDLRAQITHLGIDKHIRIFTSVNRTREMLSIMDIFVMPSRQEGLGLSIMEAQAMGLPVIASRVGGIPSLIDHEQTGILVEPENPKALAGALIELLGSKEEQEALGAAARKFIVEQYSMEKMAQETEVVYKKVVGRKL